MQDVNERGPLAICKFCRKKAFISEKANYSSRKSIFFKSEMEISTFQDAGHNLNEASSLALIMNWIGLLEA